MKIDKPENGNYCATVTTLKNIVQLNNCDNVVGTTIFGYQGIIGKEHKVGDIGIVFTTETQLSDEFCFNNNLYRHSDRNIDKEVRGYMEDNRRVRAVRFRGNVSNCFFLPLSSLAFTGVDISLLKEGDEFDVLNGNQICKKYVVPTKEYQGPGPLGKKESRVDQKFLPEHIHTDNFFKFGDTISPLSDIIVTQKLHGTSIRIANTIVKRKLTIIQRILLSLNVPIQETEYDYVFGSRKVIKDANNKDQNHFYDEDIWTSEGKKLEGLLPKNYIVYGELVGKTNTGQEIQKNYSYNIKEGSELYIYRIAIVNPDGILTDLSWDQVKEFCLANGLKHVPQMWTGKMANFNANEYLDQRFFDGLHGGYRNCLYLGSNMDLVDEGVCVRVEGMVPRIFKAKSPKFLEHETTLLDKGEGDLESSQRNEQV